MNFPCEIKIHHNANTYLPIGTYNAVGQRGNFIVVEYHLGWKYVYNMPEFCKAEIRYANVHIGHVTIKDVNKNGRPLVKPRVAMTQQKKEA